MTTRIFLGIFPNRSYATPIFTNQNKWASRSYGTAQRVEFNVQHRFKDMAKPLNFDQFKERKSQKLRRF